MAAQYCRECAAASAKLQYESIQSVWCIWELWDVVVAAFYSKDHGNHRSASVKVQFMLLSVCAHNRNYYHALKTKWLRETHAPCLLWTVLNMLHTLY